MNRIVSILFVFAIAALVVLSGCGSGKVALQHGNYYEAVITSVNHLRRSPDHKKSIETLRSAYPMGITYYEGLIPGTLAANGQFKWTEVVNNYITLNSMGDEIRRCPGALRVIPNPTNYSAKLTEAKQKAAEEQYQAGIMALGTGDREKAKLAYAYFKRSLEFVPGYRDAAQKMQDALWAATVKVLVEPIPAQSKLLASSTDVFNTRVTDYLHQNQVNEFVKFYTPAETQQIKLYPDHIVRLEFEEFNVGNVYMSEKQIPLKRDSVLVSAMVNNQTIVINNTNVTNNNIVNNTTVNNNTVNNNTTNNNTVNNNTVNNNTVNNNTTNNTVNNNTTNNNTTNNNTVNNTTNNTSNTNTVNNSTSNTNTTNNNTTNNTVNNTVTNNTTNTTTENKVEEKKEEKKEDPKTEVKEEEKKEEIKEEKKEEPKTEVKEEKKEETKEEPKTEVKEEKKEEPKTEVKEETKEATKEEKKEETQPINSTPEKKEEPTNGVVDFAVATSGTVAVNQNVCATIKCMGEAVVYNNTQDAFVKIMYSTDNGNEWHDFNSANFVKGGENSSLQVTKGSQVVLKAVCQTANNSWNNTLTTNASSEWVYVLRNGDKAPNIAPAQNQASAEAFLKGVITNGKITIGPNDVIYLFELRHVGNVGVDYQDAVMLITFDDNAGCEEATKFEAIPETDQVTICHVPPGNASARHTLTVSRSALKAHLDHGDLEGSCEDSKNATKLKEVDKKAEDEKKNNNNKGNNNKGGDKKSTGGGFGMASYQPMLVASASNDLAWTILLNEEQSMDTTKIYASVKGMLNYYAKTVSSKGVVVMTILDAKTKAVLSTARIPSEYVWTSEWATFNGDERALTSQQMALIRNKEQAPPSQQELFQAFTEPIFQQVMQRIKDFYKGY